MIGSLIVVGSCFSANEDYATEFFISDLHVANKRANIQYNLPTCNAYSSSSVAEQSTALVKHGMSVGRHYNTVLSPYLDGQKVA